MWIGLIFTVIFLYFVYLIIKSLLIMIIIFLRKISSCFNHDNDDDKKTNQVTIKIYEISNKQQNYKNNSDTHCNDKKLAFHTTSDTNVLFDHTITGSMYYTSTSGAICRQHPFIINTTVKPSFNSYDNDDIGYWPSYDGLSSSQKGFFINWLSDGKPIIDNVGYVYIYYYGLEYRALFQQKDLKEVLFEVISLVNKFRNTYYCFSLISYLTLKIQDFTEEEKSSLLNFYKEYKTQYLYSPVYNPIIKMLSPNDCFRESFSIINLFRSEINFLSARKSELLEYYMRNVLSQYSDEEIYTQVPKKFTYNIAMTHDFEYSNSTYQVDYLEIIPSQKVKTFWKKAIKVLQNDIKTMIKKFDNSNNALSDYEILAYLPTKLLKDITLSNNPFKEQEKFFLTTQELLNTLSLTPTSKITLKQAQNLTKILNVFGYEIEPNIQRAFKQNSLICIYKNLYNNNEPSKSYLTAALFSDIGFKLAFEDKELLESEIKCIQDYINDTFMLLPADKYRLDIHNEITIKTNDIKQTETIKKLLELVGDEAKNNIAMFLIKVAAADGIIKISELKMLEKVSKELNLPKNFIDNAISNLSQVEIQDKKSVKSSDISPKSPISIKLDKSKVESIKIDTQEIQSVLDRIFTSENENVENDEILDKAEIDKNEQDDIDTKLMNIIKLLITKESWTKNEFLNIISSVSNMPNSVINEINEWGYDKYGDLLIEEEKGYYLINSEVVKCINNE